MASSCAILLLLYGPALLLLYVVAHTGAPLSRASCAIGGLCRLLGAPISFNVREPHMGDVLLAGVLLCIAWLLAVAMVIVRWRRRAATEARFVAAVAAHGLLLYGGVRAGHVLVTRIQALRVMNELAGGCPSEYDMRNGWRVVDTGLGGSIGAVPARTFAEGLACKRMVRLGGYGLSGVSDGSKVLCMDEEVGPLADDCVVVSVGSNGDFTFEEAIRRTLPHCTVHVFDGTMKGRPGFAGPPSWLAPTFHYENFGALSYRKPALARNHLAVLKMDCEGCEYDALLPVVRSSCAGILLVEMHEGSSSSGQMARLLKALNETHALYYAEPNPAAPGCIEFALTRRRGSRAACNQRVRHPPIRHHMKMPAYAPHAGLRKNKTTIIKAGAY